MKALFFLLICGLGAAATEPETIPSNSPVIVMLPPARVADVQSVDGILAAVYQVISGDVGVARDWARLRSLFIAEGRIAALAPKKDGAGQALRLLTISDYIANAGPNLVASGFHERELGRRIESWGDMTVVMSCYEGKTSKNGEIVRGVNNLQLINDGSRWWVVSILFEAAREGLPLPSWCKIAT